MPDYSPWMEIPFEAQPYVAMGTLHPKPVGIRGWLLWCVQTIEIEMNGARTMVRTKTTKRRWVWWR